jgi:hypothetical protein
MSTALRRSLFRYGSSGVLATALLAACGGGEILAILQIVTPLAGAWNQEGGNGLVTFNQAETNDKLFSSKVTVQVNFSELPAVCGADSTLNGTLDSGRLTLFPTEPASTTPCIDGVFTDLRRLELTVSGAPTKLVYLNDRVAVNMQIGVWSTDNGATTLKFEKPNSVNNETPPEAVSGCDVSNPAAAIRFSGSMVGFKKATNTPPTISALRDASNNALFTDVRYVDGDTITMKNAAGEGLTLNRKNTDANCP